MCAVCDAKTHAVKGLLLVLLWFLINLVYIFINEPKTPNNCRLLNERV